MLVDMYRGIEGGCVEKFFIVKLVKVLRWNFEGIFYLLVCMN